MSGQGLNPPEVWTREYVRTELWGNVYGEPLPLDEDPDPDDYPKKECDLLEWLEAGGCGTVLDVGCGWNQYRVPEAVELSGFDVSPPMLELARLMNPGVDFTLGSVFDMPYDDDSFDGVKSRGMLRHIKSWEEPLGEMARVASDRLVFTHLVADEERRCGKYQWCTTADAVIGALPAGSAVGFSTWKASSAWDFESAMVTVEL